jgi:arginine decarboxylase-like protein
VASSSSLTAQSLKAALFREKQEHETTAAKLDEKNTQVQAALEPRSLATERSTSETDSEVCPSSFLFSYNKGALSIEERKELTKLRIDIAKFRQHLLKVKDEHEESIEELRNTLEVCNFTVPNAIRKRRINRSSFNKPWINS